MEKGKSVRDPKKCRQDMAELQVRGQGQGGGTQHRSGTSSCFPDSSRPCKESTGMKGGAWVLFLVLKKR